MELLVYADKQYVIHVFKELKLSTYVSPYGIDHNNINSFCYDISNYKIVFFIDHKNNFWNSGNMRVQLNSGDVIYFYNGKKIITNPDSQNRIINFDVVKKYEIWRRKRFIDLL